MKSFFSLWGVLLLVGACDFRIEGNDVPSVRTVSEARTAVTIPGKKCELTLTEGGSESVFVQYLERMDGEAKITLRQLSLNDEVSSELGFSISSELIDLPFDLSAYTPDSSDELPFTLGSIQGAVELRTTTGLEMNLYTRVTELNEDGSEWVSITKVAEIRGCQDLSAVVDQ